MNLLSIRDSHRGIVATAIILSIAAGSAKADLGSLGVIGPCSGTAFSNLGAITNEVVNTSMAKADVSIEVQGMQGDDLIAVCTAIFEMDTSALSNKKEQSVLVVFPVTYQKKDAVEIAGFTVLVDGVQQPETERRIIRLTAGKGDATYEGQTLPPVESIPANIVYLGVNFGGELMNSFVSGYFWPQKFIPGQHSKVEIRYRLILHPQDLTYRKVWVHRQTSLVVPFDAMLIAGEGRKAYFLDYILRSGSTWNGPIGHESVVLTAKPGSDFDLDRAEIVTLGRDLYHYSLSSNMENFKRAASGMDAAGITQETNRLVWKIDNEKPNEDILVEILAPKINHATDPKPPSR